MHVKRAGLLLATWLGIVGAIPGRALAQGEVVFPGSTAQGDILRGQALWLRSAGQYNLYTAMGDSINADTWMKLNEYIYQSIQHENAEKARRTRAEFDRRLERYAEIRERIAKAPNLGDVAKGDALNELYRQLAGPSGVSSFYRAGSMPLDADAVRGIPFMHGSERAVIALTRIRPGGLSKWPIMLRDREIERERKRYEDALDEVLDLQSQRKTTSHAITRLEAAIVDLERALDQHATRDNDRMYIEAKAYMRKVAEMKEHMKKKDIEQIISALDQYAGTTVADLLVFMRDHKLQFGVPEIGAELHAYPKLYGALREVADEIQQARSNTGRRPEDSK